MESGVPPSDQGRGRRINWRTVVAAGVDVHGDCGGDVPQREVRHVLFAATTGSQMTAWQWSQPYPLPWLDSRAPPPAAPPSRRVGSPPASAARGRPPSAHTGRPLPPGRAPARCRPAPRAGPASTGRWRRMSRRTAGRRAASTRRRRCHRAPPRPRHLGPTSRVTDDC